MIRQMILYRRVEKVDEGFDGFSDWVLKKETVDDFVNRVTKTINESDFEDNEFIISISYPNPDLAIIAIGKI